MKVLVINSGSSSLKYKLFDSNEILSGNIDGIGLDRCEVKVSVGSKHHLTKMKVSDHVDAVLIAIKSLKTYKAVHDFSEIAAVGHRIVHGGQLYHEPTLINEQVIRDIRKLCDLAPLHNPVGLAGILACRKALPRTRQYAVFDTAFHSTLPEVNKIYALPYELYSKHAIQRYGFHGISHQHVAQVAGKGKVISCHLGSGSSVCAIVDGKSFNTSMGFTPLEGLVMGTRSGDIDPAIIFHLVHHLGYRLKDVEDVVAKRSGLLGISGKTSDIRDLRRLSLKGDRLARLAIDAYCARISFYISGYAGQMGGLDCIVFTGAAGAGGGFLRRKILGTLEFLGVWVDEKANRADKHVISSHGSKVKVMVVPADEELAISRASARFL